MLKSTSSLYKYHVFFQLVCQPADHFILFIFCQLAYQHRLTILIAIWTIYSFIQPADKYFSLILIGSRLLLCWSIQDLPCYTLHTGAILLTPYLSQMVCSSYFFVGYIVGSLFRSHGLQIIFFRGLYCRFLIQVTWSADHIFSWAILLILYLGHMVCRSYFSWAILSTPYLSHMVCRSYFFLDYIVHSLYRSHGLQIIFFFL